MSPKSLLFSLLAPACLHAQSPLVPVTIFPVDTIDAATPVESFELTEDGSYRIALRDDGYRFGRGDGNSDPPLLREEPLLRRAGSSLIMLPDGGMRTTALHRRGDGCRVIRHDAQMRRIAISPILDLTTNQDSGCLAFTVAEDGESFVLDSGDGIVRVAADGAQRLPVPVSYPIEVEVNGGSSLLSVEHDLLITGSSGSSSQAWLGRLRRDGSWAWQRSLEQVGIASKVALVDGVIHVLVRPSAVGTEVGVVRLDSDGNILPNQFQTHTVIQGRPTQFGSFKSRAGTSVHAFYGDAALMWRSGDLAPRVLPVLEGQFRDFDIGPDGKVYVTNGPVVFRFGVTGLFEQQVNLGADGYWIERLRVAPDGRVLMAAGFQGRIVVLSANADLAITHRGDLRTEVNRQISSLVSGTDRIVAQLGSRNGINVALGAVDRGGRRLWELPLTGTGHLGVDNTGFWQLASNVFTRVTRDGQLDASFPLPSGLLATGSWATLRDAGPGESTYWSGSTTDGACQLGLATRMGITIGTVLPAQCTGLQHIAQDGHMYWSSGGVMQRRSSTGQVLWSTQDGLYRVMADGGIVIRSNTALARLAADGTPRWQTPLPPSVAEEFTYFGEAGIYRQLPGVPGERRVLRYDVENGAQIGERTIPRPADVGEYVGGQVLADGSLFMLQTTRPSADTRRTVAYDFGPAFNAPMSQRWEGEFGATTSWRGVDGAVYTFTTTSVGIPPLRPVVFRAGGEILLDGFE